MKKIKVLYIDDEEINLEVFYSTFRKKYDVYTAISADEGMKILDNNNINVIISDQRMPEKTGVSFFEEVKVKFPDTIRIILTAYADYETAYESINRGFVFRFMQKPWDFEDLVNIIEDSYKIYTLTTKNKELANQYQLLFDHHTIPVFIVDKSTFKITKANKCAVEFFSLKENDFNLDVNSLFPFKHLINDNNKIIGVLNGEREKRMVNIRYEDITWDKTASYLISIEDQTELIAFEKAKLDFMSRIQDKERKQLSMELHDGLAQELVLLKLYVEESLSKDEQALKSFLEAHKKIINSIRSLSYSLNPPDLKNGFSKALENLFLRLEEASKINFIYANKNPNQADSLLDQNRAYNLYRICQEFINNSLKHSKAKNICSKVEVSDDYFLLEVKDDGIGFNSDEIKLGDGLKNMEERAKIADLKFEIESKPMQGTTIRLLITL
ncbi:MAG: response regulator [Brumimicrobium sp.]